VSCWAINADANGAFFSALIFPVFRIVNQFAHVCDAGVDGADIEFEQSGMSKFLC
jgi:hypothetical protein